jgi:Recombination endonuclease VII
MQDSIDKSTNQAVDGVRRADMRLRGEARRCIDCRVALSGDSAGPRARCSSCAAGFQAGLGFGTPGGRRDRSLRKKYGVSEAQVLELIVAQGNTCWACRVGEPLNIDHDHMTGEVRGVVCSGCNSSLGAFGDTLASVERVLGYLTNPPGTALTIRPVPRRTGPSVPPPPREELERAYGDGYSQREIGEACGVGRAVVNGWMKFYGLPVNTRGDATRLRNARLATGTQRPPLKVTPPDPASYSQRREDASWNADGPEPIDRTCSDCKKVLPLSAFYSYSRPAHPDRPEENRRSAFRRCMPCTNAYFIQRRHELHGGPRGAHLRYTFGLDEEQFNSLVERQGGTCPTCTSREPEVVDHDHATGAIRGALCGRCNSALGFLNDRAGVLRLRDYLLTGPAIELGEPEPLPRRTRPVHHQPPNLDVLHQLYLVEGQSPAVIANQLGVQPDTVRRWLVAAKIPLRTSTQARNIGLFGHDAPTHEERFERLVVKTDDGCWLWQGKGGPTGRSPRFLIKGKEVSAVKYAYQRWRDPNIGAGRLFRICAGTGCVAPDHHDRRRPFKRVHDVPEAEVLRTLYEVENMTVKQIADLYHVDPTTCRSWLTERGIAVLRGGAARWGKRPALNRD